MSKLITILLSIHMKNPRLLLIFIVSFLFAYPLSADPRACVGNDTVVASEEDSQNLMSYLKGTWSTSGTWQILEGEGKVKKVIKTRILGTETFTTILNGHFLQKTLNAKVKYHSRDLDKMIQLPFSSMTVFTFNENVGKYYYWLYDSTGSFLEAGGNFNRDKNQYTFTSLIINESGNEVENMLMITIVDDDHYRWESKERDKGANTWTPAATGLSTRKRS
jgi:hypothetical protein